MEANKDSALHYIELAEKAILANDNERALRYLTKSENLFPTQKAKGLLFILHLFSQLIFVFFFSKDLIERLMYANSHSQSSSNHRNSESASTSSYSDQPTTNGTSSSTRQRTTTTNTNSTSSSDYTLEEVEAVRKYVNNKIYLVKYFSFRNPRIKTCKDLYDILGVNKSATEADLKKAYRKLALQVRLKEKQNNF
jgi:DnaJ family protein B protein 12